MTGVVFDCMIYLQAVTNEQSPAYACFELAESNKVQLHISPAVLAEVRDVLARPKITAKFPHLTPERVQIFLQKVATFAAVMSNVPETGLNLRDPDDLPYLDLAIAAGASYLVSRDKDVLDLMKDTTFTSRYGHLSILDPNAFLRIAGSPQTPERLAQEQIGPKTNPE